MQSVGAINIDFLYVNLSLINIIYNRNYNIIIIDNYFEIIVINR